MNWHFSPHESQQVENDYLVGGVYVCVCVCVLSPHLFWTSALWTYQPGSYKRKVTRDFPTFLLRRLPFNLYREKDSAVPFPRRPWSRVLCTYELIVLRLLGIIITLYFFERKNPSSMRSVAGYLVWFFLLKIPKHNTISSQYLSGRVVITHGSVEFCQDEGILVWTRYRPRPA